MMGNVRLKEKLLSVSLLLLLLALSACREDTGDQKFSQARLEASRGERIQAIDDLKSGLRIDPENRDAWMLLGRLYLEVSAPRRALTSFRKALLLEPEDVEARIGVNDALLRVGAWESVLSETKEPREIGDRNTAVLASQRALALARAGRFERARALLARISGAGFATPGYWIARIRLVEATQGRDAALEIAEEARRRFPERPELLLEKTELVDLREAGVETEATLRSLMDSTAPGYTPATAQRAAYLLVNYYTSQGKLEDAERIAGKTLRQYPEDYRSHYLGGLVALISGRYDRAERRFLRLEKSYRIPQVRLLLGVVYMAKGEYERARFYLANYYGSRSDDRWAAKLLVRVYLILGDRESAQSVLALLDERKDDAEMEILRGLVALMRGDAPRARELVRNAISLAGDDPTAIKLISRAEIALGDYPQAASLSRRVLAEYPGDVDAGALAIEASSAMNDANAVDGVLRGLENAGVSKAWIETVRGAALLRMGRVSQALDALLPLVRKHPGNLQAMMVLALAAENDRKFDLAESLYKKLLQEEFYRDAAIDGLVRISYARDDLRGLRATVALAQAKNYKAVRPLLFLGAYHVTHKNFAEAEKVAARMDVLEPGNPAVLLLRAGVEAARNNPDAAKRVLTRLAESHAGQTEFADVIPLMASLFPDIPEEWRGNELSLAGHLKAAKRQGLAGNGRVVDVAPGLGDLSPGASSWLRMISPIRRGGLVSDVTRRGTFEGLLRLANVEVRKVAHLASAPHGGNPALNYSFGKKGILAKISRSIFFKYFGAMSQGRVSISKASLGIEQGVWDGADIYDEAKELRQYLWRDKRWKVRRNDKRLLRMPSSIAWAGIALIVIVVLVRWQKRKALSAGVGHNHTPS